MATGAASPDSRSPVSIGFITYDSQLHFYSLVKTGVSGGSGGTAEPVTKPQMHVVADTAEVFVPSVEGFLVPPEPAILTNLLSTIPSQFTAASAATAPAGSAAPDPFLGPAIQAGLEALKAANRCGKLFILHSSLPTADAPGKLKLREDRHLIGTDREKVCSRKTFVFVSLQSWGPGRAGSPGGLWGSNKTGYRQENHRQLPDARRW